MAIYTSRFSNPELKKDIYTTVRISIGMPRWKLGYRLDWEISQLMPFGMRGGQYEADKEHFKKAYFARLDKIGVATIREQLARIPTRGTHIVLLCYEDILKNEGNWCHRTMFAEWWLERTGEKIEELPDPTIKIVSRPGYEQMTLF